MRAENADFVSLALLDVVGEILAGEDLGFRVTHGAVLSVGAAGALVVVASAVISTGSCSRWRPNLA